ncbi:MAG TPA: hypothetical protein VFN31_00200 [Candidatus Saccharimonadales bacterium]|nr:hypothetical protein [Candidatus Saccharimonadales bacterium]
MSETSKIVIASSSFDELTYGPVQQKLEDAGHEVVVYKTDRVFTGEDEFTVSYHNSHLRITYNDTDISPDQVGALWYRKIAGFSVGPGPGNIAKQLHFNNELRSLHDTIWSLYPKDRWLNSPDAMRVADRKIGQLMLAHEIGFEVPKTVISSSWSKIDEELRCKPEDEIIVKMLRGIFSEGSKLKAMFTTVLNKEKLQELYDTTTPFPGVYQPYIAKKREWRITVVGNQVFPAAIITTSEAKDDWRKLQQTPSVLFQRGEISNTISARCINYLSALGLKYGAFDFIATDQGDMVFLECNPNGQYGWLEDQLGLPISNAISSELSNIAKINRANRS